MAQKTIIADAIETNDDDNGWLTREEKVNAYDLGNQYASNKMERINIATAFARQLGESPSYFIWEANRIQWVDGYTHQNPDNTANAGDKAWLDFTKLMGDLFGVSKPKSTGAAASKKAAERTVKQAQLLEKYADDTAWELRGMLEKAYQALAKNPTNKDNKKIQKEVEQVLKIKTSAENKENGEALKQLRADVRELINKCVDIEKLEAVMEILDDNTDVTYVIED